MRTIQTVVLLAAMGACQAQSPYRPFPEANAGWVETHGFLTFGGPFGDVPTTCQRTIETGSDTAISDTLYHELRIRSICAQFGLSYPEPESRFCWFRQDVGERKVYVYDLNLQHGVLWFDFTLPLGPYPTTWGHENGWYIHVLALDSIELNDGWHRSWILGQVAGGVVTDSAFCKVIEGVGSTYGLNPVNGLIPPFEWNDALDCHSVSGSAIYPLAATGCDLTTGDRPGAVSFEELRVFPNPGTSQVRIEGLPSSEPVDVALHDGSGRCVRSWSIAHGSPGFDVQGIPHGIYTVRVVQRNGTIAFIKLAIE